jgi:hypothetical protein
MGSVVVFDVAKRKEPTESRGPKGVKVKDLQRGTAAAPAFGVTL